MNVSSIIAIRKMRKAIMTAPGRPHAAASMNVSNTNKASQSSTAWQSFEAFYADMGARPAGLTLDRKDTNGNYEKSNCRWATTIEQARNRNTNVIVEIDGKKGCLAEFFPTGCYSAEYAKAQRRLKKGLGLCL